MIEKIKLVLIVGVVASLFAICIAVWVVLFLFATLLIGADPWGAIPVVTFIGVAAVLVGAALIASLFVAREVSR